MKETTTISKPTKELEPDPIRDILIQLSEVTGLLSDEKDYEKIYDDLHPLGIAQLESINEILSQLGKITKTKFCDDFIRELLYSLTNSTPEQTQHIEKKLKGYIESCITEQEDHTSYRNFFDITKEFLSPFVLKKLTKQSFIEVLIYRGHLTNNVEESSKFIEENNDLLTDDFIYELYHSQKLSLEQILHISHAGKISLTNKVIQGLYTEGKLSLDQILNMSLATRYAIKEFNIMSYVDNNIITLEEVLNLEETLKDEHGRCSREPIAKFVATLKKKHAAASPDCHPPGRSTSTSSLTQGGNGIFSNSPSTPELDTKQEPSSQLNLG